MNRRNLLLFLALGMMVSEGNRERREERDTVMTLKRDKKGKFSPDSSLTPQEQFTRLV